MKPGSSDIIANFGIVPAVDVAFSSHSYNVGYFYYVDGDYWVKGDQATNFDTRFGEGDVIAVCLDLDVGTVAFRKNGDAVGSPQEIPRGDYYFAFDSYCAGVSATILSLE